MLVALNINTKEIIASGVNRSDLSGIASDLVGPNGFCIRNTQEAVDLPKDWAASTGQWWV